MPTPTDINDIIVSTHEEYGRGRWTDLTTDTQRHYMLPQLLKEERVVIEGSIGPRRQLMVDHSHSAAHTGLYGTTKISINDVMRYVSSDWRFTQAFWGYDDREKDINSGAAVIVDLIRAREAACDIALAELIEETGWSQMPTITDTETPFGIPYYVVRWPTGTTALGFNGANPVAQDGNTFTSCAGQDASTLLRWRNYCGRFVDITAADLVRGMRETTMDTDFRSPISMPNYSRGTDRLAMYGNKNVVLTMAELAEAQNDQLGKDVASMDGEVLFHRRPITWIPYLENITDSTGATIVDQVIGIDWSCMYFYMQRGGEMQSSAPQSMGPEQHNVYVIWKDLSWNLMTDNRRRQWVLSTHNSTGTTT